MINKVMLIGRLGKDPKQSTTKSGLSVLNLTLATSQKYKDKEETTWHDVVCFGKHAESLGKFARKGQVVYVGGQLSIKKVEKDGAWKTYVSVLADTVRVLSSGKGGSDTNDSPSKPSESPVSQEPTKVEDWQPPVTEDSIPF